MKTLSELPITEKQRLRAELNRKLDEIKNQHLNLDMTRGKPSAEQLDLADGFLTIVDRHKCNTEEGIDGRNYGGLDGISEAKKLFSDYLEVTPDEIIIGGNSSLRLMYDTVAYCMTHGTTTSTIPWSQRRNKFLCPVPGYDRHFTICDFFGIDMIPVPLTESGPDMNEVERLVSDETVRGMWCVPKYGNPTGYSYSDETVEQLASMPTASPDFRLFWDNAYQVHHLGAGHVHLRNILEACKSAGNPDRVFIFGSTAKVIFPSSSLALMGGSISTMEWVRKRLFVQTIGPDKLNMIRHVLFFKNITGIMEHMEKHAQILAPKFKAVQNMLKRELGGKGIATWTNPRGGYFVSLNTPPGCAAKVVERAAEHGVKFTKAGATFPYKKDPKDSNIRIAPSFPVLHEIEKAVEVLCLCLQDVALEKELA